MDIEIFTSAIQRALFVGDTSQDYKNKVKKPNEWIQKYKLLDDLDWISEEQQKLMSK